MYTDTEINHFSAEMIPHIAQGMTVKQLVDYAYQRFHLPIIVTDTSYHLIAATTLTTIDDPHWYDIVTNGRPKDPAIDRPYLQQKMPQNLLNARQPVVVDSGACAEHPQTSSGIWLDNELLGFGSILLHDASQENIALELNQLICQMTAIILKSNHTQLALCGDPIKNDLASKLFDPKNYPNTNFLDDYPNVFNLKPYFIFFVIRSKGAEQGVLSYLNNRLTSLDRNVLTLQKADKLYLVSHHEQIKPLKHILASFPVHCGISRACANLKDRAMFMQQAELAADIDFETTFTTYQAQFVKIILDQALQHVKLKNLIQPELALLTHYDHTHATDYLRTLKTYLHQRNNLIATAAQLHIGRADLAETLNDIKNLLHEDIDNVKVAERLWLSVLLTEQL